MPIFLELFWTFFKLGLFSFGGGYAMLTLIQKEVTAHGWLTPSQFADIVAVAEMTPGPVAVNTATYVGHQTAGLAGGLIASVGVTLPSLLLVLTVAHAILRYRRSPYIVMAFYGLRPVVIGLIFTAALVIGQTTLLAGIEEGFFLWLDRLLTAPLSALNPVAIVIFLVTLLVAWRDKVHPLLLIFAAGAAGGLLMPLWG